MNQFEPINYDARIYWRKERGCSGEVGGSKELVVIIISPAATCDAMAAQVLMKAMDESHRRRCEARKR
jgi:hypothetical protein